MKKKKLLPFSWLPASWGLTGKSRQRAEAEYYYNGEDLERQLCQIEYNSDDQADDLRRAELKIDLKYSKISQEEYDEKIAVLEVKDTDEAELRRLAVRLQHGKISTAEHDKRVAEIKKEPWVNVIGMGVDPENVTQGFFELDWNDEFVKMLQDAGIQGTSDEDIVNKWFNGVCKTVLLQEGADLDYGLQQNTQPIERTDVEIRRDRKE
jgi:hypothetical protein